MHILGAISFSDISYFKCTVDQYFKLNGNQPAGEETLSKLFYLPSEKGSTLKGQNLFLLGANLFVLEQTWKAIRKSQNLSILYKEMENHPSIS